MPEIILTHDEEIIQYINELNLPYSSALQNRMVNMISGIMLSEDSKNISLIYSKVTCNRHRRNGSRSLGSYNWNNELIDNNSIYHSLKHIRRHVDVEVVGFLILDDTLSKKDTSTNI